jgi:ABC-2 type transport system permease protein
MAVYKRAYRAYAGELTPPWSRFLILTRYGLRGLFRSRVFTGFFVLWMFPFLIALATIYLSHNTAVLALLHVRRGGLISIDAQFFSIFMSSQTALAFFLIAFAGPGLISPDLANNALPLYFSRPFSRAEYVFGKFCVLACALSTLTWIPALTLFAVESSLSGVGWMWSHLWIAGAVLLDSAIVITVLSLLALAMSAWVKWKPVAGALILAVIFLGAGLGVAINAIVRTRYGLLVSVGDLFSVVSSSLFQVSIRRGINPAAAWIGLLAFAALFLRMLARKVRAYEVVR